LVCINIHWFVRSFFLTTIDEKSQTTLGRDLVVSAMDLS